MTTWTADRVEAEMIAAFRAALKAVAVVPVYSSAAFSFVPCGKVSKAVAEPFDVLSWTERFVPDRERRRALLVWARARATGDHAIAEFCREMRWDRRTFDRRRRFASAQIAVALDRLDNAQDAA